MSDIRVLPRPATSAERVNATTVEMLERLLARAKAGDLVSFVAVTWHDAAAPEVHMSTEDRILALGAIRVAEHGLVRDWLDGSVTR